MPGLQMHRDVFALVALGEIDDGRIGRVFRRKRRLPVLDARDDVGGLPAGVVDGEVGVAMGAAADPLRAAEGARLDNEDLPGGGYTRKPKPGSSLSQKAASLPLTERRSTVRARYWPSAMVRRSFEAASARPFPVAGP